MNIGVYALALVAPQQLVDPRLGAGFRVDLLDDDRAIETIPAVGAGQAARYDHGAGRDAAVGHLPRGPVVDLGALGDIDPHGDDRPFADDDALDDLAAGADEAVVLDDRGVRLQRLEHAADADPAREVHVPADLRAGAHGRPRIDHRALVHVGADVHVR